MIFTFNVECSNCWRLRELQLDHSLAVYPRFPATELGATAINGAVKGIIDKETVEECLMGNVLSANVGQAPT